MFIKNAPKRFASVIRFSWVIKYYPFVITAICFLIAVFFKSRAFALGYMLSGLVLFFSHKRTKFKIADFIRIGVVLCLLIVSISFLLKRDSSLGRLLIYKLSIEMLKDHIWTGVGTGRFGYEYLNYQYNYFVNNKHSIKQLLLADNTKHAFNDYLQFVIENGALGLIVLLSFLSLIFFSMLTAIRKHREQKLLSTSISQITALAIAALFTHVFEHKLFQVIAISCLLVLFLTVVFSSINRIKMMAIVFVSLALIFFYCEYPNYKRSIELRDANNLFQSGYTNEASLIYLKLYSDLKDDVMFLNSYSDVLLALNKFKEQELILQNIVQIDNASVFHLKLARCYSINGKLNEAEQEYLRAIYTVPGRLVPRFELFEFYLKNDKRIKAIETGKALLKVPVKIHSKLTTTIKSQTKRLLAEMINDK